MLTCATVKGENRMIQIIIDLMEDRTIEERLMLLELLYYECGSRRIIDIVNAFFI